MNSIHGISIHFTSFVLNENRNEISIFKMKNLQLKSSINMLIDVYPLYNLILLISAFLLKLLMIFEYLMLSFPLHKEQ
jgi:hypothetical protein